MTGRWSHLLLVTAVTAGATLPATAGPATARTGLVGSWNGASAASPPTLRPPESRTLPRSVTLPIAAQGDRSGCAAVPAPVEPVTEPPWAQRRYAPQRLGPLATGAGVTVAVIDSGVNDEHVQLRGQVRPGRDFLDPGRDGTRDCPGHGTAVASIIAAAPRTGVAFHGLAPRARILPVRVSEQQIIDGRESGRTVTAAEFAEAIRWSVERGADVLNLSVVLYADDAAVRSAIDHALAQDVVVVAAVGNLHGNGDPRPYPAGYPGVLGVGAIGPDGLRTPFSQVGPDVDVVAPGGAVLAAAPGRGHREQNGTSYATPFVAATAALLREYRPDLSAAQVVERIIATADPAPGGGTDAYGSGVLNPYRALTDTGAVTGDPPDVVVPRLEPDAAAVAGQERRAAARHRALWLAGGAVGATALAALLAIVLPRGVRRRWRPGGSVATS